MIYSIILAGGKGSRMGNFDRPKQFLEVGNRPIIIHTIEKFILNQMFEKIIIVTPKDWLVYTRDIIKNNGITDPRVVIVVGGADRNESIMSGIRHIEETNGIQDDDIVVTHDSVRPFLTHRIISENIEGALKYGAVNTVVSAIDTIVQSEDGKIVSNIPERKLMYQGQTPQSFNINKLIAHYESLSDDEKLALTDACKICLLKGDPVHLVRGETFNVKITTPFDLILANAIIKERTEA
jgi:2-C-methyl-D-erythritol 4-phosphate cytidylyltransferase